MWSGPTQGVNPPPAAITKAREEMQKRQKQLGPGVLPRVIYKVYAATGEEASLRRSPPCGSWAFDVDIGLNTVHLLQNSLASKKI